MWCSSIEASPKYYDSDDWQLKKSEHSYESSKYQIDLLATTLNQATVQSTPANRKPTKHFISEPGVCSTSISAKLIHPFLDYIKLILFYVVSLGSLAFSLNNLMTLLGSFLWVTPPYDRSMEGSNRLYPSGTCSHRVPTGFFEQRSQ